MRPVSLLPFLSLSSALAAPPINSTAPIKNANHIFNAIQDSMRQWGSSLHHNGVSFFLARVPAGTEFYHGTSEPSPINGTEWLAFEPEHAMVFARPHRGPPPHQNDDDTQEHSGHGELRKRDDEEFPGPPHRPRPEASEDDAGYLHTYAAAKDLRLLYLDGMSAAKTAKGTLDSQDLVLFNGSIEDPPRGGRQENERARLACELAENEWEGRIDGVLRMEAGFEIILCQFERDLTPVRVTQVKQEPMQDGPHGGPGPRDDRKHGEHGGPRQEESIRNGPHGGPGPKDDRKHGEHGGPRKQDDGKHHDGHGPHEDDKHHHDQGPHDADVNHHDGHGPHEGDKHHESDGSHEADVKHHNDQGPRKDEEMHHQGRRPRIEKDDKHRDGHGPHKQDDGERHGSSGPGGPGGPGHGPDSSRWMRAVTARYNGIGGNRVSLNFDHFVTAFSHDGDLFQQGTRHPRLSNLSEEELAGIRDEVTDMIKFYHPAEVCEDWQAITDMIVTRYSKVLSYFASGKIQSIERLQGEIERVMSPFIDFGNRDSEAEVERCATQFLPTKALEDGTLAAEAIYEVARKICSSLVEAQSQRGLKSAVRVTQDLVAYLNWATWKDCRGCEANEICVVPIWPMGTVEDYERPSCRDASNPYPQGGESYWGGMHG